MGTAILLASSVLPVEINLSGLLCGFYRKDQTGVLGGRFHREQNNDLRLIESVCRTPVKHSLVPCNDGVGAISIPEPPSVLLCSSFYLYLPRLAVFGGKQISVCGSSFLIQIAYSESPILQLVRHDTLGDATDIVLVYAHRTH